LFKKKAVLITHPDELEKKKCHSLLLERLLGGLSWYNLLPLKLMISLHENESASYSLNTYKKPMF
jgi:hypothetical protein